MRCFISEIPEARKTKKEYMDVLAAVSEIKHLICCGHGF